MACDIRIRAERRTGELLKELARAETSKGGVVKSASKTATPIPPSPYAETLERTGISRVTGIRRRGFAQDDAEDLAELLRQRDARHDPRRLCLECARLAGARSIMPSCRSGYPVSADCLTVLHRCPSFRPVPWARQISPGSTNVCAEVSTYLDASAIALRRDNRA